MAKNGNTSLERAKKQKNDEFYTRRADVELELAHYKEHFAYGGRIVMLIGTSKRKDRCNEN